MKQQEIAFLAQLCIANKTKMPIVIHCRDTEQTVYEILKKVYLNHLNNNKKLS